MSNNHSTAVGGAASNLESVLRTAIHFKIQVVPRAEARLVTRWRPASCNCHFRLRRVALRSVMLFRIAAKDAAGEREHARFPAGAAFLYDGSV